MQDELLDMIVFGNTVRQYVVSLTVFVAGVLALKLFEGIVLRRMKARAAATQTKVDDVLVDLIDKASVPVVLYAIFYVAVQPLQLHAKVERAAWLLGVAVLTYAAVRLASATLTAYFEHFWLVRDEDRPRKQSMRKLLPIARALIWVSGAVFLLDNVGFRISAVVTGLGIGGVAVALAAQAILGDLFSYFAIVLDRPFEVGDYITVGEFSGWVEHIGIKTTRLRSQSGEQLIVPNKDLTGSRLRNFSVLERRRVLIHFGIVYQTVPERVREVPAIFEAIVEELRGVEFERCHFKAYGPYSLDFEGVFHVEGSDYMKYMDLQQEFNLALMDRFKARSIEFAYPTQTIFNISREGA